MKYSFFFVYFALMNLHVYAQDFFRQKYSDLPPHRRRYCSGFSGSLLFESEWTRIIIKKNFKLWVLSWLLHLKKQVCKVPSLHKIFLCWHTKTPADIRTVRGARLKEMRWGVFCITPGRSLYSVLFESGTPGVSYQLGFDSND